MPYPLEALKLLSYPFAALKKLTYDELLKILKSKQTSNPRGRERYHLTVMLRCYDAFVTMENNNGSNT